MLVTLFGMLILVSELQKENASFPMLVTLSGMLMQLRDSVIKWISFHLNNTIRYIDACQRFAPGKRPVSNTCYAIRYVDAGQRFAPVKRRVSNACHTVRYVYVGQRFAPAKR